MPSDKPPLDKLGLNLQGAKLSGLSARSCCKNGFCECRETPVIQIMQWGFSSKHLLEAQGSLQVPVQASAGNPDNPLILWHSGLQGNKDEKVRNESK